MKPETTKLAFATAVLAIVSVIAFIVVRKTVCISEPVPMPLPPVAQVSVPMPTDVVSESQPINIEETWGAPSVLPVSIETPTKSDATAPASVTPSLPELMLRGKCLGLSSEEPSRGIGLDDVLAWEWSEGDSRFTQWQSSVATLGGRDRVQQAIAGVAGKVAGVCVLSNETSVIASRTDSADFLTLRTGKLTKTFTDIRIFLPSVTGGDVTPCEAMLRDSKVIWRCDNGSGIIAGHENYVPEEWVLN